MNHAMGNSHQPSITNRSDIYVTNNSTNTCPKGRGIASPSEFYRFLEQDNGSCRILQGDPVCQGDEQTTIVFEPSLKHCDLSDNSCTNTRKRQAFTFTFNCSDMRDAILGLNIKYGQLNQLNWTISNYTSGINDFTNLPDVSTMVIRDKHKYPHIYPFLTNQCNRKELINETDGTLLTDYNVKSALSVRERIDYNSSNFSPKNFKTMISRDMNFNVRAMNPKAKYIEIRKKNYVEHVKAYKTKYDQLECEYPTLEKLRNGKNIATLEDRLSALISNNKGDSDIIERFDTKFNSTTLSTCSAENNSTIDNVKSGYQQRIKDNKKLSEQNDCNASYVELNRNKILNHCYARTDFMSCQYCRHLADDKTKMETIVGYESNITTENDKTSQVNNLEEKCQNVLRTKIDSHVEKSIFDIQRRNSTILNASAVIEDYCADKNNASIGDINIQETSNPKHDPCADTLTDEAEKIWGLKLHHARHLSSGTINCINIVGKKAMQIMSLPEKEACFVTTSESFQLPDEVNIAKQLAYENDLYCNYIDEQSIIDAEIFRLNGLKNNSINKLKTGTNTRTDAYNTTKSPDGFDSKIVNARITNELANTTCASTCSGKTESLETSVDNYITYRNDSCETDVVAFNNKYRCNLNKNDLSISDNTNKTLWEDKIHNRMIELQDKTNFSVTDDGFDIISQRYDCLNKGIYDIDEIKSMEHPTTRINNFRTSIKNNEENMGYLNDTEWYKKSGLKSKFYEVIDDRLKIIDGKLNQAGTRCVNSNATLVDSKYVFNPDSTCEFVSAVGGNVNVDDDKWTTNSSDPFGENYFIGLTSDLDYDSTCDVEPRAIDINQTLSHWENNLRFAYKNDDGVLHNQGIEDTFELCSKYGFGEYLDTHSMHINHPLFKDNFFDNFFRNQPSWAKLERKDDDGNVIAKSMPMCPSLCDGLSTRRRLMARLGFISDIKMPRD
tara:strand:+ start:1041 stop:3899 length:2859 start_codon:yes stop_codon:yes gene_type:complete